MIKSKETFQELLFFINFDNFRRKPKLDQSHPKDTNSDNDSKQLTNHFPQIFRLSEDILDQIVQDDGEIQTSTVVAVYLQKTPVFLSLYKKYCLGLKRADCVLVSYVTKLVSTSLQTNSLFVSAWLNPLLLNVLMLNLSILRS